MNNGNLWVSKSKYINLGLNQKKKFERIITN